MDSARPQWSWPSDLPSGVGHFPVDEPETTHHSQPENQNHEQPQPQPKPSRHYGPRTCRICFEVVHPTFEEPTALSGFLNTRPRPIYKSEDDESGRLISPCKCKGSQRYVHEGCLQAWRYADSTAKRNFFSCPTCGYQYKLERLSWANRVQSTSAQILLTISIFLLSVFLLGFVADPIMNLWADPIGTLTDVVLDESPPIYAEEPGTWLEHFLKGFFSLGLVGFLKSFLVMSPWQWWHIRSSGLLGTTGRRGGTGRARVENINIGLVIIGATTFLWGVWKAVRRFSASALQRASDRVFDVGGDEEEDNKED
ncbi:E3 ubiquitin-protein ligase MARCH11 [Colletotrichum chlorophyti]|uniref:E3 ubiquitin-protein ligase MARCH11 n=1 Tax=Colletotrichum chlorophyti TaxID=708187 RepID=A0A1Q8RYZ7_9PEZI|nr:E3 ubiquitin-protein ligase MARCH11 [Colletotrichum chlorophyti]